MICHQRRRVCWMDSYPKPIARQVFTALVDSVRFVHLNLEHRNTINPAGISEQLAFSTFDVHLAIIDATPTLLNQRGHGISGCLSWAERLRTDLKSPRLITCVVGDGAVARPCGSPHHPTPRSIWCDVSATSFDVALIQLNA